MDFVDIYKRSSARGLQLQYTGRKWRWPLKTLAETVYLYPRDAMHRRFKIRRNETERTFDAIE